MMKSSTLQLHMCLFIFLQGNPGFVNPMFANVAGMDSAAGLDSDEAETPLADEVWRTSLVTVPALWQSIPLIS